MGRDKLKELELALLNLAKSNEAHGERDVGWAHKVLTEFDRTEVNRLGSHLIREGFIVGTTYGSPAGSRGVRLRALTHKGAKRLEELQRSRIQRIKVKLEEEFESNVAKWVFALAWTLGGALLGAIFF